MATAIAVLETSNLPEPECPLTVKPRRAPGDSRRRQSAEPDGPRLAHLASAQCARCHGLGYCMGGHSVSWLVCACVRRQAFRACLRKYHTLGESLDRGVTRPRRGRSGSGSLPACEFRADFILLAKRTLADREMGVFWLHKIHQMEWRECCRRLHLDRGNFFHAVYRLEQQVGKACMETQPFGLFPTSRYFQPADVHSRTSWGWQTRA